MRLRLALVISKRHQRSRAYGRSVVFFQSPNHLGLVGLDGIVAPPRLLRTTRRETAGMKASGPTAKTTPPRQLSTLHSFEWMWRRRQPPTDLHLWRRRSGSCQSRDDPLVRRARMAPSIVGWRVLKRKGYE